MKVLPPSVKPQKQTALVEERENMFPCDNMQGLYTFLESFSK